MTGGLAGPFIYYLYRLVALWAIWRLLTGRMNRLRVIVRTGLAELLPCLLSVPAAIFLTGEGENLLPIMIPVPFLWFSLLPFLRVTKAQTSEAEV